MLIYMKMVLTEVRNELKRSKNYLKPSKTTGMHLKQPNITNLNT